MSKLVKLTKKTIEPGQVVKVVDGVYKLNTLANSPWYKPSTALTAYDDIGTVYSNEIHLETGETLKIRGFVPGMRAVAYVREKDNKVYSSYLGEFTTFVRLEK